MAFLTDADILQDIATTFKQAPAALGAYWAQIAQQAHAAAYQDIVGELENRGYTAAQIAAWDRGAEFERVVARYHWIQQGAALDSFSSDYFLSLKDRRKELKTVAVYIAGVWVKPLNVGDGPGLVGTGEVDTSRDTFVPFDPEAETGNFSQW